MDQVINDVTKNKLRSFNHLEIITIYPTDLNSSTLNHWSRRRRTRTVKVRTALSRPCPGYFSIIRAEAGELTESRQTESGQTPGRKSGQNPDSRQNGDRKNPDRQTSDSIFLQNSGRNPDSGQNPDTGQI